MKLDDRALINYELEKLADSEDNSVETTDKPELPSNDLSWMWHCTDNPKNVLDYSILVNDKKLVNSLNTAASMGFRGALRKLEEMKIIEMGDIDRGVKYSDQEKWNSIFSDE